MYSLNVTNRNKQEVMTKEYNQLNKKYDQLETYFDPNYRAIWCVIKAAPVPVFTPTLLTNIRSLQNAIAKYSFENPANNPKYIIWQSDNPNVFSLGLDINHIYQLILDKDQISLNKYIDLCIDVLYINLMKLDLPLIGISYLRGKALGGGFEAVLSNDIIIAEKNARCSFPEIRYNLLPSLGSLKMLLRRFSPHIIEPLLLNGKSVNSDDLLKYGLVHHVIDTNQGKDFIVSKIQEINPRHELFLNIYKARLLTTTISFEELNEFKKTWTATVLNLKVDSLARLKRLAQAQQRYGKRLVK